MVRNLGEKIKVYPQKWDSRIILLESIPITIPFSIPIFFYSESWPAPEKFFLALGVGPDQVWSPDFFTCTLCAKAHWRRKNYVDWSDVSVPPGCTPVDTFLKLTSALLRVFFDSE